MDQIMVNWVLGLCGVLFGFLLRVIWTAVSDLQKSDKDILEKITNAGDRIASVEILVAGEYLKREEFSRLSTKIFDKLDRIEEKLDSKEDKKP